MPFESGGFGRFDASEEALGAPRRLTVLPPFIFGVAKSDLQRIQNQVYNLITL